MATLDRLRYIESDEIKDIELMLWYQVCAKIVFRPPSDGGLMIPENVGVDFFQFVLKSLPKIFFFRFFLVKKV